MRGVFIMKNILIFVSFAAILVFSGCYTQMATKEPTGYTYVEEYDPPEGYQSDENYEAVPDSENYSTDTDVYYPSYRRYYEDYYPGISIGLSWGAYWYSPFIWDPYYYSYWYSPYYPAYYYYPGYYYYYPPVCYWGGYNDPYYGGYYSYYERGDDVISHRNGDGLRSPLRTTSVATRTNTILKRDPGQRDKITSLDTRSGRNIVSNDTRSGRNLVTGTTRTGKTSLSSERNGENLRNTLKNSDGTRTSRNNTLSRQKREGLSDILGTNKTKRNSTDLRKKLGQRDTGKQNDLQLRNRKSGNNNRSTDINKSGGNRQKTYSPPTRNSNPPQRTYSPPSRNSGGNNSAPRTNSGGGNRGGGNTGGRRSR
jgi:hypothetical protein